MVTSDKTMKAIEPTRPYTVAEVRDLLGGLTYTTALKLIKDGQLKAKRVGRQWLILGSSILAYPESDDDDN